MKLLFFILAFISLQASAASITVPVFNISFFIKANEYTPDFELKMACRYEKFVIGDSAEYEYTFKMVPLEVRIHEHDDQFQKITIINSNERKLELKGWFKSNKECQTMQKFFLKSRLYSIGWAGQFDRPITLGLFEHSRLEEYAIYDVENLRTQIENKELGFLYNQSPYQVNIRFAFDGIGTDDISFYMRTSALADPETQMPYTLKQ